MSDEPLDPGLDNPAEPWPDVDVPDLPKLAEGPAAVPVIKDRFGVDVAVRLAFLGLGQGGSRIAQQYYRQGYGRVCVLNTTHQDLDEIDAAIPRLDLQTGGAGKDPAYAAGAIQGRQAEVFELLQRSWGPEVDLAIICVGLGGGTGTGTAPIALEVARKYLSGLQRPPRVGCILALPTLSEGGQQIVARNVVTGFRQLLKANPSPVIILDNARIGALYQPKMPEFFDVCNRQVGVLLHLFNRLAAQRSKYITFDRSELTRLLDSGILAMGASAITKWKSPADVSEAIRQQLATTVLAQVDLSQARQAACVFVGGPEVLGQLPMDFFEEGFSTVQRMIMPDGLVHRGVYEGTSPDLRCYTMLAELPPPTERLEALARTGNLLASGNSLAAFLGVDG